MEIVYTEIEELARTKDKRICVFGAGEAGSIVYSYLRSNGCNYVFIADNDKRKHCEIEPGYIIGSMQSALRFAPDIYIISFTENNRIKMNSALSSLAEYEVEEEKIKFVNMDLEHKADYCAVIAQKKFERINISGKKADAIKRIVLVGSLFRKKSKSRVMGGTTGAVNMQRLLLGDKISGLCVECMMFPEKREIRFDEMYNKYEYALFSSRWIAEDARRGDAVYISNDVFSACTLAKCKQKYIFIYHGQGDFVSDMNAFGAHLTEQEKKFITWVEKTGMENSFKTYFPSIGARKYFLSTVSQEIKVGSTEPLYNCIYDYPGEELICKKEDGYLSFLSIGQMTKLKGMDRIPVFLEKIRICTGKRIRWIVVADGELKKQVADEMKAVSERNGGKENIDYEIIDEYITHNEIYALMAKCDIYLMLHRVSIFDFSTLEAMYMGKAIILSDIAGNDEFNVDNNILMVNEALQESDIVSFIQNMDSYGMKNRRIYDEYFSVGKFRKRYYNAINELLI